MLPAGRVQYMWTHVIRVDRRNTCERVQYVWMGVTRVNADCACLTICLKELRNSQSCTGRPWPRWPRKGKGFRSQTSRFYTLTAS